MAAGTHARAQRGSLMIEVLVTMVVCVIGLWGLAQLQLRLQASEMEAYQRTQALLLLDDLSARIRLDSRRAPDHLTETSPVPDTTIVGLLHGRTCVEAIDATLYRVTVAWQGLLPHGTPSAGIACGQGAFDRVGTVCNGDRCRRTASALVRIAELGS